MKKRGMNIFVKVKGELMNLEFQNAIVKESLLQNVRQHIEGSQQMFIKTTNILIYEQW